MTDDRTPRRPLEPSTLLSSSISPAVVWQIVRKHWSIALAIALAVSLAVTFRTLRETKIYEASATVLFDPNPPRPLGQRVETVVDMGSGTIWDNHEYYETQYKIIQSMRVALAVVADLGLQHDGGFIANTPPGKPAPQIDISEDDAAQILRGRVKVEPVRDSRLAVVKLEDADPQRAQRILAALVDKYVEQNLDDALTSTNQATEWLRGRLDGLKGELETSEMALHEYKEGKNILSVSLDDQSNMLREEMKQISDALTSVRTRREEVAARRAELAKIKAEDPKDLPASELLQNDLLKELRRSYEDAVRERDALLGLGKGKNHPEVQSAEAMVTTAKTALLSEVRNIQRALDGDLAVLKRQEAGLAGLFERAKKQALDLNLLEIEYNRLRRSKENNEKLYSIVLERTKESELAKMLRVNNVRVVDRPLLPKAPIRPNVPKSVSVGVVAGLILGIGAALLRGLLDRSIKTSDDLERDLGVAFLGLLPEIGKGSEAPPYRGKRSRPKTPLTGSPELVVHEQPTSGIAEAARTIRTNLLFMAPDKPYKTLLVTSAGPAEGKTTVASCIAIAMAQAGQRVVLIDCDLRRPRVHRVFRKSSELGVTTAVIDHSIDAVVLETEVPNLFVIPAGPTPPHPSELLHSESFKKFLAGAAERFDRVIIDSPPVVPVTDAAILSTLVDATVLVVRAFKTSHELARHALRALNDIGARKAGAVLNAVNLSRHEYKYSHYYYYRKDGYYAEDREPAGRKGSAGDEAGPPPPPH
ncbi:MAG: polysaccharide biosynthesis tyrosine autokinase [Polyangiaceae bacterium]|nr:polysaccharide biosynthesis tyrosine autokinase [Polyangiaceae bacterium]